MSGEAAPPISLVEVAKRDMFAVLLSVGDGECEVC